MELQNPNPEVSLQSFTLSPRSLQKRQDQELNFQEEDEIDSFEVFDLVKSINDPEHPLSLEQLKIVSPQDILVTSGQEDDQDSQNCKGGNCGSNENCGSEFSCKNQNKNSSNKKSQSKNYITLYFTPTIPHCSLSQTIGLFIKVKLIRSLPEKMKITVLIKPGTHSAEQQVNKQVNDKERIAAALENPKVVSLVNKGIRYTDLKPEVLEKLGIYQINNNNDDDDDSNNNGGGCCSGKNKGKKNSKNNNSQCCGGGSKAQSKNGGQKDSGCCGGGGHGKVSQK